MALSAMRRGVAALGITGMLVTGTAVLASTASAATPAPQKAAAVAKAKTTVYKGKVVSRIPLDVRAKPTTKSAVRGTLRPGTIISITCKVNGQKVDGNARWYELAGGHGWVSARYVANIGPAPRWC
jgi:hypothetical protein